MNEETARTKWCPFARVVYHYRLEAVAAANRPSNDVGKNALCIASDCMAWRWTRSSIIDDAGYCGLAGRPDSIS